MQGSSVIPLLKRILRQEGNPRLDMCGISAILQGLETYENGILDPSCEYCLKYGEFWGTRWWCSHYYIINSFLR